MVVNFAGAHPQIASVALFNSPARQLCSFMYHSKEPFFFFVIGCRSLRWTPIRALCLDDDAGACTCHSHMWGIISVVKFCSYAPQCASQLAANCHKTKQKGKPFMTIFWRLVADQVFKKTSLCLSFCWQNNFSVHCWKVNLHHCV